MATKRTRYGSKIQLKKRARLVNARIMRRVRPPRAISTGTASFKGTGFPNFLKMKHVYNVQTQLACSSATIPVHLKYNCIGLYQPDVQVSAGRVMLFNQLTTLYSRYTVIGAKIKWIITPFSDTIAQPPQRYCAWINENSTITPTGFDALVQYRGAQLKIDNGGINPNTKYFNQTWSTKKRNRGSIMSNQELSGTAASNPLETPQFTLSVINMGSTAPLSCYVNVKITYIVIWHELKEVIVSV